MIFNDASSTLTTRRISLTAISSSESLGMPAMVLVKLRVKCELMGHDRQPVEAYAPPTVLNTVPE